MQSGPLLPAVTAVPHAEDVTVIQAWQAIGPDPARLIEVMSRMVNNRSL